MQRLRWQLLIAAGGLILVLVLLLGQSPDTPAGVPEPQKGGAYTEALVGSISRLNPVLDFANQVDRDIDRLLYSGLVRFDSRGMPVPDLAEGWSVSADATLYTFRIRPEAVWHDGQPVTADDVVYTFSKMQDDAYPGPADVHKMWKKVNVIRLDEHNVQFQLPEPFAPFMDYLAVGLLPEHLLRGVTVDELVDHPFNLNPIGTGPFQFDRFFLEDGKIQGVSLIRNDRYHGDVPFLERVDFRLYPDSHAALQPLLAGEVQGIQRVDLAELPSVLEQAGLNVYSSRLPIESIIFLNNKEPEKTYLAEKRFRQALLLAINRQTLIDQVLGGQGIIAVGPILPGTWAFNESQEPTAFDPDRASQLLESLGYGLPVGASPGTAEYVRANEDGVKLSLELVFPDDDSHAAIAELIQGYWQAIGVETTLKGVPSGDVLTDYLEPREYQAVLTEINLSRSPDPDPYPFWHDTQSENGQNYSGFSDRNSSIWLEQARINPDYGRRAELYRSFQHRFLDQLPALPLYHPVYNTAVSALVQGIRVGSLFDPSDRLARINEWYTVAGRKSPLQSTPTP